MRKIGKCKACKQTVARDYNETMSMIKGKGMYQRQINVYGRNMGGRFIVASDDCNCPACGAFAWDAKSIQGVKSDHVCNDKCTSAKGFQCECSCGGENHGKSFVCAAA
jgi:uncharacterized protein YcgI (DUF1989 family)